MPSLFTHPPKITSLREGQALTDRMAAIQNQAERAKWLPLEVPRADNQNISAAESARNKRDQLIGGGIVGAGAMVTPSTPAQGQPAPSLFTQQPSVWSATKDLLMPEWAKPFAGMSAEQANREAQILASGKQAPGKIGPGYMSNTDRLGMAVMDAASLLK